MVFSVREQEVISLLLEGKSNKQIALALGVSVRTAEYHLGNIYAKLQVSSRSEAIIQLSNTQLWKPTSSLHKPKLRQATVETERQALQNQRENSVPTRRFSLKTNRSLAAGLTVFLLIVLVFLVPPIRNQVRNQIAGWLNPSPQYGAGISTIASAVSPVPATSTPSAREQIVAQEQQLAAEYDQTVKAEMQSGSVETSQDSRSGKEVTRFTGDSATKIEKLYEVLNESLQSLNQQYLALYVAEVQPTPFPTQSIPSENDAYYQHLLAAYSTYFDQILKEGPTVAVYDPDDGTYYQRVVGDAFAKGEIMAEAMETLHQAPEMAKIDQGAFISEIRQIMDNPDLSLTFRGISSLANARGLEAATFVDDSGTSYSVAIDAGRLVSIDPATTSHIEVPAADVKPIEEVRPLAEQFAAKSSLRFGELKNKLSYEESSKGDIYFFRWNSSNQDWSGTPPAMMPPFLQVGMSADGKLVTYVNTLDLDE